ncbi:hypothetical protein [Metapseudomonas otitidis]|uniref:hypothetical protein n=1 Tax=Metapseudomonas otitidis TaxID=319939 RepID=UPI0013F59CEA|nr:hypothetical protein [Pseudomonas otitidis]
MNSNEEMFWREHLSRMRFEFQLRVEPIIRRLVELEAVKPPAPFYIEPEQAKQLGLLK